MNIFDSLDRDEAIRALALQAAADSVSDNVSAEAVLRKAKMFAAFIRTGSTDGR